MAGAWALVSRELVRRDAVDWLETEYLAQEEAALLDRARGAPAEALDPELVARFEALEASLGAAAARPRDRLRLLQGPPAEGWALAGPRDFLAGTLALPDDPPEALAALDSLEAPSAEWGEAVAALEEATTLARAGRREEARGLLRRGLVEHDAAPRLSRRRARELGLGPLD